MRRAILALAISPIWLGPALAQSALSTPPDATQLSAPAGAQVGNAELVAAYKTCRDHAIPIAPVAGFVREPVLAWDATATASGCARIEAEIVLRKAAKDAEVKATRDGSSISSVAGKRR